MKEDLVEDALSGCEAAWVDLLIRVNQRALRYGLWKGIRSEDLHDFCQEVVLRIKEELCSLEDHSLFEGWLGVIIHNCYIDLFTPKRKAIQERWFPSLDDRDNQLADSLVSSFLPPDLALELVEATAIMETIKTFLGESLQRLASAEPDKTRAIRFSLMERRSYKWIAKRLKITVDTVGEWIRDGLRMLRNWLHEAMLAAKFDIVAIGICRLPL